MIALPWKKLCANFILPCGENHYGFFLRCPTSFYNQPQIIYIGETVNLKRRFNVGYGKISPRNCYMGGQSTNCKMNKVVMEYYKCGKPISLYFHQTEDHKYVELDLLKKIETRYNAKDN